MIGLLGTPGALAELPYKGGLTTDTERPVTFKRTLGGKRKAMLGPRARREWAITFDMLSAKDTNALVNLARSAGEVMWFPADATSGNLLSPDGSGFEVRSLNAVDLGFVSLPDGSSARAVAPTGTVNILSPQGAWEQVPVRPGTRVTFGGWGFGGIRFTGRWRDKWGANIGSFAPSSAAHEGWAWVERSVVVPAGAELVSLSLSNGQQYARPSITWGINGRDQTGRGCPKAVVHSLSEGLKTFDADGAHGSISVTITEVG